MSAVRRARGLVLAAWAALWIGGVGCHAAVPLDGVWLAGGMDERFATVARHLRGLDVAMIEVGHRYAELHFAGLDRNWDAAAYQAAKIRLSLELAIERRPKRRSTTLAFLEGPQSTIDQAIAARDGSLFDERFEELTAGCNACHAAEKVAFFHVVPPAFRTTVLRGSVSVP